MPGGSKDISWKCSSGSGIAIAHAIGRALQTYATQRALDVQQRREEYLAFVAHDLRTP